MDNRSGINANGRGRNCGGGGGGGGSISPISIPAASMKIIHGLKEIVNCSEQEIYSMLKECNMDPNEAISRLISQDPFHEVRSRHEKKKASKDTTEPKSRSTSTSNRGSRGAERHAARGSSNQSSSYDSGVLHSRSSTHKKDGGQTSFSSFSSGSRAPSSSYSLQPPIFSDSAPLGNTVSDEGGDIYTFSQPQPSSTCQPSWLRAPGQLSMAEVVKMGRSQGKSSNTPNKYEESPDANTILAPASTSQFHDNCSSMVSQITVEAGVASTHVSASDEWPLFEQTVSSSVNFVPELSGDENFNGREGSSVLNAMEMENLNGGIDPDDNAYEAINSFHSPSHQFEAHECGADSASFGEKLEQLNLEDDKEAQPENDKTAVKIPSHLQVHTEDFSHLSFGSFGSVPVGGLSGLFSSVVSKNDGASSAMDAAPVEQPDTKNVEYFINEHSMSASIENYNGQNSSSYEPSSVSSPEQLKSESHEPAPKDQYSFPSSTSGYSPESTLHLNPSLEFSKSTSQILNQTSFSNAMSFQNSLPNSLLMTPSNQAPREADFPFSPFSMLRPPPSPKYNNVILPVSSPSSITSPPSSLPLPEVQKGVASNLNNVQSLLRAGGGGGVGGGGSLPHNHHNHHQQQHHHHHPSPLQQHHPYTQPTIPVTHFANMIGYPLLPQTYPYVPPAFQHMIGNSYHHSVPHQQHSPMVAPAGYSGFGTSPGTFSHNPAAGAAIGASSAYDDVTLSQYKEENAAMWGQRAVSSGVGSNPYYNMEEAAHMSMRQSQQMQQAIHQQQQQQQYGGGGYPNVYHSAEHQQLSGREGGAGGAQVQHGKQSQQQQHQQMWQSSY